MDILEYKLKGYCCSQIVTEECLKKMGKENPDFVEASAGFCFGMGIGSTCGIITSAMAMLYLKDAREAMEEKGTEFVEWFEEVFGATNCEELLEGNPLNKVEKCPMMIEASLAYLDELMELE